MTIKPSLNSQHKDSVFVCSFFSLSKGDRIDLLTHKVFI